MEFANKEYLLLLLLLIQEEDRAHDADERHLCLPLCTEELEGDVDAPVHDPQDARICDDHPGAGPSADAEFMEE